MSIIMVQWKVRPFFGIYTSNIYKNMIKLLIHLQKECIFSSFVS